MSVDVEYMDEILRRKGFKALDESLRSDVLKRLWNRIKPALELEVQLWNNNCEVYDAATTKILFHGNPFMTEQMKSIAELTKDSPAAEHLQDWLTAPNFSGSPMGSVCAETVSRDVVGKPKVRVYVWLTQHEPCRIMYSFGETCKYNEAIELPIRIEAGAPVFENGEDESGFVKRAVRDILTRLMEEA